MTGNLSAASNARHILLLLLADLVISLGLAALIARRLAILWIERKKGRAGSRLHGRLVALFSVVAVAPTILVAAFPVDRKGVVSGKRVAGRVCLGCRRFFKKKNKK